MTAGVAATVMQRRRASANGTLNPAIHEHDALGNGLAVLHDVIVSNRDDAAIALSNSLYTHLLS